jgi:hypothetical protein
MNGLISNWLQRLRADSKLEVIPDLQRHNLSAILPLEVFCVGVLHPQTLALAGITTCEGW